MTTADPTPRYAALLEQEPPGSSWSVWGDAFRLGSLNNITPANVAAAAASVRNGNTFALGLDLDEIDPPLFNRTPPQHRLTNGYGALHHDDVLDGYNTQLASQWDGLRHVRHHVHGWYGGVPEEEHGMQHWAHRGIAGRGLLVDVERWHRRALHTYDPASSSPITVADLEAALAGQGSSVRRGDILCLRTGWLAWYRRADAAARRAMAEHVTCAGLAPGHEMLEWLWDHGLGAVAADNPTVELWPIGAAATPEQRARVDADQRLAGELSMHRSAIPLLGLVFGELFDFDALAEDRAANGAWEFFLASAPIGLPGGAASPANALAFT